jgi:hypothetical protein
VSDLVGIVHEISPTNAKHAKWGTDELMHLMEFHVVGEFDLANSQEISLSLHHGRISKKIE